jgi:hypothetical protein
MKVYFHNVVNVMVVYILTCATLQAVQEAGLSWIPSAAAALSRFLNSTMPTDVQVQERHSVPQYYGMAVSILPGVYVQHVDPHGNKYQLTESLRKWHSLSRENPSSDERDVDEKKCVPYMLNHK